VRGVSALGRALRLRPRLHRLARILRFRLRLHPGWAAAFILITAIVVTQFPEAYAFWQRIVLGISASLLFFAAVSIREIILSFLALSKGMPVKRVTLFVFGGVSPLAKRETLPVLEVLLATAGLLYNLIMVGILYAVYSVLVSTGHAPFDGLILWLAYLYFLLALFHFIPVLPLDGGRLLRALLWKETGYYDRATAITSWAGQGVGLLIIAWGILLLVLSQRWFGGLVLVFIGWFLHAAAVQSRSPMILHKNLRGVKAQDVVDRDCPIISRQLSLSQLVRGYIMATGQRYFIVADGVRLEGIITVPNIKKVPPKRRHSTKVGEVMTPPSELVTAQAEQPAASLLEKMNEWQIDYVPVLEQGRVIGIVVRDSLMRLVKTRAELGR